MDELTKTGFHGFDRIVFAVDEWQHYIHQHLPMRPMFLRRAWFTMWRPLCDRWDQRLTGHTQKKQRHGAAVCLFDLKTGKHRIVLVEDHTDDDL